MTAGETFSLQAQLRIFALLMFGVFFPNIARICKICRVPRAESSAMLSASSTNSTHCGGANRRICESRKR